MSTIPSGIGSTPPPSSSTSSTPTSSALSLTPTDFINMMVTELQNQDPMQPASNEQLLSQMSEIGQLQSSTDLQSSLQGMVTQNSIGAASGLIGKSVQGLDSNNNPISGVVTSVQVAQNNVTLELDSGAALPLANVTTIAPTAATTGTATGTGAAAATPATTATNALASAASAALAGVLPTTQPAS